MEKKTAGGIWKRRLLFIILGLAILGMFAFGLPLLNWGTASEGPSRRTTCVHYFTDEQRMQENRPFETGFRDGRYIHYTLQQGFIRSPLTVEEQCTLYYIDETAFAEGNPFQMYSPSVGWVTLLNPLP